MLSLGGSGVTALSPAEGASLLAPRRHLPSGDDGEAPWHDQTLPIAERMKLAEGRPLPRRMMAAMAQQDCGQCGYLCDTYAAAIASGAEKQLNLCAPGGKETAPDAEGAGGGAEAHRRPPTPRRDAVAAAPAAGRDSRHVARHAGRRPSSSPAAG